MVIPGKTVKLKGKGTKDKEEQKKRRKEEGTSEKQ